MTEFKIVKRTGYSDSFYIYSRTHLRNNKYLYIDRTFGELENDKWDLLFYESRQEAESYIRLYNESNEQNTDFLTIEDVTI